MAQTSLPPVPDGLRESGRKLWEATVGEFELAEHEAGLLLQACRGGGRVAVESMTAPK